MIRLLRIGSALALVALAACSSDDGPLNARTEQAVANGVDPLDAQADNLEAKADNLRDDGDQQDEGGAADNGDAGAAAAPAQIANGA